MNVPVPGARAERLRIDRALGRAYADAQRDPALFDAFRRLHLACAQRSLLLRPVRRPVAHDPVAALRNLAAFHSGFRRAPEDWVPDGSSVLAAVASLARHLFDGYRTPRFLASCWFGADSEPERELRAWAVAHGEGRPFRRVVAPLSMSRRVEHHFLGSPDHLEVGQAIRRAEILALGGSPQLAERVVRTAIGDGRLQHPFWSDVLRFFVVHEDELCSHALEGLVDGLVHFVRPRRVVRGAEIETLVPPRLELEGRSVRSLLSLLAESHGEPGTLWGSSGQRELVFELERPGRRTPARFEVVELRDRRRLRAEGNAMGHCVGQLEGWCRRGFGAIWSIRRQTSSGAWRSVLTFEVDPALAAVVEASGRFNQQPSALALTVLERWASLEGLDAYVRCDDEP